MSESTAAALGFGSYIDEPPLSPSGLRIAQPTTDATPEAPAAAPATTSVEALLLRFHLLTSEQMAQALGERLVSGKSIETIALERGWITQDDLAQVQAFGGTVVAPTPTPAPAPAAPLPLAPEVEPQPPATSAAAVALVVRLANGERIPAGTYPSNEAAMQEGRALTQRMQHEGEWPFLDGRFVRPDAVVSIDLETSL